MVSLRTEISQAVFVRRSQVIEAMVLDLGDALAPPPPPKSLINFARGLRIPENGPDDPGYDPDSHPAQRDILYDITAGAHNEYAIVGPAQDGKTLVVAIVVAWTLVELRRSVVLSAPDMRLTDEIWRDKVLPLLQANGYGHLLPTEGAGSESAMAPSLLLKNGARLYRLGAGAKNQAGQASRTAWLVVIDERDDVRDEKAAKLHQRNKSGGDDNYLTIELSTIKRSRGSAILRQLQRSEQRRVEIACLHCGSYFAPDWHTHRQMDEGSSASARATVEIICPHCQEGISPEDLAEQSSPRRGAKVVATRDSYRYGIQWSCLTSHRSRLRRLAASWVDAQAELEEGQSASLETIYQDDLAQTYEDTSRVLAVLPDRLARRSAQALYEAGAVPSFDEAPWLTHAIDVQHRRLYNVTMAHSGDGKRWWISDHWRHAVCGDGDHPSQEQVVDALDAVYYRVMSGQARPDGQVAVPAMIGIDVKDGTHPHREVILQWIHEHPGCYPLHGQGERQGKDSAGGAAILRIPGVLSVNRQTTAVPAYDLLAIAGDILKGAVLRDLSRDHGSSSCGYIPHGEAARGWLIKELCAERLEDTPLGPRYVKTYQHNHRLDCAVYNRALGKWLIHSQAHAGGDVSAAAAAIGGSTA